MRNKIYLGLLVTFLSMLGRVLYEITPLIKRTSSESFRRIADTAWDSAWAVAIYIVLEALS